MSAVQFVKKHKIVFGVSAIALVGILGYALFAGGGGGGGSTVTEVGPTPQEIEANAQIALAQIQATNAAQQTQAQVGVRLAEINAQQTVAQLELQNANLEGQRQAEVALYTVGQQAAVELARTQTEERVSVQTLQTALAQSALSAQTTQYTANAQLQAVQAQVSGDVQQARIQADAAKYSAKKQAKASQFSSIVQLGVGLLGLFSDARLKQEMVLIETDRYGVRWYSYRYREEAKRIFPSVDTQQRFVGVCAQDLLGTQYQHAVSMVGSYYTVDYSKLPAPPVHARIAA